MPSTERRTFVLFTLVRAAEFLSRFGAISGHLPSWIVNFRFWDVLVMSLSAMQILFSYVACPHVRLCTKQTSLLIAFLFFFFAI